MSLYVNDTKHCVIKKEFNQRLVYDIFFTEINNNRKQVMCEEHYKLCQCYLHTGKPVSKALMPRIRDKQHRGATSIGLTLV